MVLQPENYTWSSHNTYLQQKPITWVDANQGLNLFADTLKQALAIYKPFIAHGLNNDSTIDFEQSFTAGILADEKLVKELLTSAEQPPLHSIDFPTLINNFCRHFGISEAQLKSSGRTRFETKMRALLTFLVRESQGITIGQLAKFLNRDPSGLSKRAAQIQEQYESSTAFKSEIDKLRDAIIE